MATLTATQNKTLDALLSTVMKQAAYDDSKTSFNCRLRVTATQRKVVEKACKNYQYTDVNGVVWEVNYSNPQNDQLPVYFYGQAVTNPIKAVEVPAPTTTVEVINKTQVKKELAQAKRDLKEVSKEYDRAASRSVNADVDMGVIRVLGRKYDLQAKVIQLTELLESVTAKQ